jgi:sporulation protein YlmC with PRC-barrel domain
MSVPDDLHVGADVYSSDGQKLGELHRVVIRPSDLRPTHIVVDIGFLRSGKPIWQGGIGLDYDRVVPIRYLKQATEERVELDLTRDQFKDAPEYTFESYEAPQDLTPGEFDIPDVVNRAQAISDAIASIGNVWVVERLNKPKDTVDIKENTPVWRRDPHEKLGDVHRVLFTEGGRVQAFVIRRGVFFKREVILPVRYVVEMMDDLIRVDIPDDHVHALKEYQD